MVARLAIRLGRLSISAESPNGAVIGTVENGLSVHIVQTLQDNQGRSWSSLERPSNHQTLGWVFRDYITCTAGAVTAQYDNPHVSPSTAPPPEAPKDTPQLKQARTFLEDAQKFIAEQKSVPELSAIANEAATLKIAISKYDEAAAPSIHRAFEVAS